MFKEKKFFGKLHPPIDFLFCHNARDFIVEEIPLYDFINSGEHRILKIRKKNLSTFSLINAIRDALKIRDSDIGYAGLKDKYALTYQYVSVPDKAFLQYKDNINNIKNIAIIESSLHSNKLKIGHLKGNKFIIRLKKVNEFSFSRLKQEFERICKNGFPNFFGYQRFGTFGDNYTKAKDIKKSIKQQNAHERLIISSLQSYYFNLWLQERIKISLSIKGFGTNEAMQALKMHNITLEPDILKILQDSKLDFIPLPGDLCRHNPFGKLFYFATQRGSKEYSFSKEDMLTDIKRLEEAQISITGLLSGINCTKPNQKANILLAKESALDIESKFCHEIEAFGSRRSAWVYPSDTSIEYIESEAHVILKFSLPSGCYATSLLEYIKNDSLQQERQDSC